MGFAYDDAEAEDEDDDIKVDKEFLKGGQNEIEDLQDLVEDYIVNDYEDYDDD
jgi:hypothetical protein